MPNGSELMSGMTTVGQRPDVRLCAPLSKRHLSRGLLTFVANAADIRGANARPIFWGVVWPGQHALSRTENSKAYRFVTTRGTGARCGRGCIRPMVRCCRMLFAAMWRKACALLCLEDTASYTAAAVGRSSHDLAWLLETKRVWQPACSQ
jgi:hypothetical protein